MTDTVQQFRDIRATMRKNEVWRDVDFSNMMPDGMKTPQPTEIENKDYPCNIPGINTIKITVINGRCVTPYYVRLDGVSYGSLTEACKICPDLIGDYLCKCTKSDNPYEKINASNYEDGVFIYIPDGTLYNPTFQIVNIIDSKEPIFVQTRNLVVVGKRATLTLLQCDDSIGDSRSMSNNVTEIFAGSGAKVQHYKLQNMNDMSGLLNHSYAQLEEKAVFSTSVVTLNGGHIRNHAEVNMLDEHCRVDANGLYLIDKRGGRLCLPSVVQLRKQYVLEAQSVLLDSFPLNTSLSLLNKRKSQPCYCTFTTPALISIRLPALIAVWSSAFIW